MCVCVSRRGDANHRICVCVCVCVCLCLWLCLSLCLCLCLCLCLSLCLCLCLCPCLASASARLVEDRHASGALREEVAEEGVDDREGRPELPAVDAHFECGVHRVVEAACV